VDIVFDLTNCAVPSSTPSSSSPRVTFLCDSDHIPGIPIRVTLDLVKNRVIAGLMVAAMLCGSGTVTFASLAAGPAMMQHATSTHQRSHACCPGSRLLAHVLFVTSKTPIMPCGEHPCCAKRMPPGPASLPAVSAGKRPEAKVVKTDAPMTVPCAQHVGLKGETQVFLPPHSARSAVLRI